MKFLKIATGLLLQAIIIPPIVSESPCPNNCRNQAATPDCIDAPCKCRSNAYIVRTAQCTFRNCGPEYLDERYNNMVANCERNGYLVTISREEFIELGTGRKNATDLEQSKQSDGPKQTEQPMQTEKPNDGSMNLKNEDTGGLSRSDKIALGCGIAFGVPSALGAVVVFFLHRGAPYRGVPYRPPASVTLPRE